MILNTSWTNDSKHAQIRKHQKPVFKDSGVSLTLVKLWTRWAWTKSAMKSCNLSAGVKNLLTWTLKISKPRGSNSLVNYQWDPKCGFELERILWCYTTSIHWRRRKVEHETMIFEKTNIGPQAWTVHPQKNIKHWPDEMIPEKDEKSSKQSPLVGSPLARPPPGNARLSMVFLFVLSFLSLVRVVFFGSFFSRVFYGFLLVVDRLFLTQQET